MKYYDLEKDGVTQSLLSSFINCHQQCEYILNKWEMPKKKTALIFGGLFHFLIEHYLKALMDSKPIPDFSELERMWIKSEGKEYYKEDPEETEKLLGFASALFPEYVKFWERDDTKRIKWLALEEEFDVNYEGFKLRGKRDGLLQYTKDKKKLPWLLETKTTSRIDEGTLEEALEFNFQNLFYLTATEIETKQKLGGILYNIIRKPQGK